MAKFRKAAWSTFLFVALLAPFAVVVIFSLMLPDKRSGAMAPSATATAPAITEAQFASHARLLAAGDAHTLWLVRPVNEGDHDHPLAGYRVLQRASNTGIWTLLRIDDESDFTGFPHALAVTGDPSSPSSSTALVITDGEVENFTNSSMRPDEGLPAGHELLAMTGSPDGVFALTRGVPPAVATRPGDRLTTEPATQPATIPASSPAATLNAYRWRNGHWTFLPSLGASGPRFGAHVALAVQGKRLIAFWVDSNQPRNLIARALEYKDGTTWSAAVTTTLDQAVPAQTHLLPITLEGSVYLFWPVATGDTLKLHGGRLATHPGAPTDLTLPRENLLPPMILTPSGEGVNPQNDVAIAAAENSIAVVISGKDNLLMCTVFNNHGQEISPPSAVNPLPPKRNLQIVDNAFLLIFLMVLALALWQWRHRPRAVTLPADLGPAPLYLRALGFTIDFGIATLATASIFGMWDSAAWQAAISAWSNAFVVPEALLDSPELLTLMGIYLAHVTLGELFFRRSVGKMITGTQVLLTDGRAPTVAAILLRNILRVPEMIPGLLTIYVLISMYRQRIGDFLAGTIVVAPHAPDTPEDPDAKEKRGLRDNEKKS